MRANSLSDVKKANKSLLYECIRERKRATKTELERITGLSRPTIAGLVSEMETEEIIIEAGRGASSGGRTPTLYGINARAAFALGIDLEFPRVRMTISDLEGEPICGSIRRYPPDSDRDAVISLLLTQIESLLGESEIDTQKLLGIGMGIPGVIDIKNKFSIVLERIRGWANVPIGAIVEQHFGRPVYIRNDVSLMARAEQELFKSDELSEMLYIALRQGIGMSVWLNGKPFEGEGGNAGRLGHMLVNTDGPECWCGSRGCLGQYTGERAMCAMYRKFTGREITRAAELMELAAQGDEAALNTLETTGHYLGIGIVNVANLFDISHVVISAPFDPSAIIELAKPALAVRNEHTMRRKISIGTGKMAEPQYALGGCLLVLEYASAEFRSSLVE